MSVPQWVRTAVTGMALAAGLSAQSAAELRITAQTLSKDTASAMFGRLPKSVQIVAVEACNEASSSVTVPLSRIVQRIKAEQGMTILPQAAAISVVSASQGATGWQMFSRYGSAALTVVSDLSALQVIKPGIAAGALVVSAATMLGVGIRDFGPAVTTHQNMVLASSMMPDPIQLPALGCTPTYYALIEADSSAKQFDFSITIPEVKK